MKLFLRLSVIGILSLSAASLCSAQDDEARQQSGLPSYIGNRPGANPAPGSDARVSGTVEIQGLSDETKAPSLSVSVLANGVLVATQRVKNKGAFSFTNVPRHGVSLIVEIDNQQIGSYPLGTLTPPPMANRKDIFLIWNQAQAGAKDRNEVVSYRNVYIRSTENQKVFEKAVASLGDKKSETGMRFFKQIVEKDPSDFVSWTELGNLYFTVEIFSEAEIAYKKALVLKLDFLPALVNLGKLYLSQKSYEKAIETLTKALDAKPDSADINQYLGESYLSAKKGSKAVVYLNKAIELSPVEKADIHLRLASLYNAAGAKDRAAKEYKMLLTKVPGHPEKAKMEKYVAENTPK